MTLFSRSRAEFSEAELSSPGVLLGPRWGGGGTRSSQSIWAGRQVCMESITRRTRPEFRSRRPLEALRRYWEPNPRSMGPPSNLEPRTSNLEPRISNLELKASEGGARTRHAAPLPVSVGCRSAGRLGAGARRCGGGLGAGTATRGRGCARPFVFH